MENEQKTMRESKFELLRIISMLWIIMSHYIYHGDVVLKSTGSNLFISLLIMSFGRMAVNIFVLISGYFLIESHFKSKKVWDILLKLFCCSMVLILIKKLAFHTFISYDFVKVFHPLKLLQLSWFIPIYLGTYVLSPFLNKVLNTIDQKQYRYLLLMLSLGLFVFPLFHFNVFYHDSIWFVFLYCIGGYIKKYAPPSNLYAKGFCVLLLLFVLFTAEKVFFHQLKGVLSSYSQLNFYFNILGSICIIGIVHSMKMKNNLLVNTVAKSVLGIYILHDNDIIRNQMWKSLKSSFFCYTSSLLLVFYMLLCTLAIFMTCLMLDKIISNFMMKLFNHIPLLDNLFIKCDKLINGDE